MTALPDWDNASDAELATAAAAGERAAFAGIYDRYVDRLYDFCVGMVRDRDAAADCVQDVFCTAAEQLPKLRDPDKLRPWLYAIARNEALGWIRQRRREHVVDQLPEAPAGDAGPDTLAARTELAALVTEAAGGLSDRDRSVLELTYRHGLDGPELADALGVSAGNATKMVSRLRETIERSLGALLVARRAQRNPQGCAELSAILAGWDGEFSVLLRKRIARHIDSCPTCEENRRELVSPAALLGGAPILIPAPWWLRGHTLTRIQLTAATGPAGSSGITDSDSQSAFSAHHTGYRQTAAAPGRASIDNPPKVDDTRVRRARLIRVVAVIVGILFVAMGLTMLWLRHQTVPVGTTDVTQTTRPPSAVTAPSNPPPAPPPYPSANVPAETSPPGYVPTPVEIPRPANPVPNPPVESPVLPPPPAAPPAPVPPPPPQVWLPPVLHPPPVLPPPAESVPPRSPPITPPRRPTFQPGPVYPPVPPGVTPVPGPRRGQLQ
jgi:RNA polymerase sigma factor (sigma-70 family)